MTAQFQLLRRSLLVLERAGGRHLFVGRHALFAAQEIANRSDLDLRRRQAGDRLMTGKHADCSIGRCRRYGGAIAGAAAALAVLAVFGCSANQDVSTLLVDPGHYSAYHCKDFAPQLARLTTREEALRNLMDKANESGGGAIVGNLSYRADYEDILGEEKVLRRAAAEKNCDLSPPAFQSDQTIH